METLFHSTAGHSETGCYAALHLHLHPAAASYFITDFKLIH